MRWLRGMLRPLARWVTEHEAQCIYRLQCLDGEQRVVGDSVITKHDLGRSVILQLQDGATDGDLQNVFRLAQQWNEGTGQPTLVLMPSVRAVRLMETVP